jgi:hypothetical protein
LDQRIEIPEHANIWHNPKPAVTQHCKTPEGNDGIGVEVNQLLTKEVHDSRKKFTGRKAQPNDQIGFKADYDRIMDNGNIYLRNRGY